MFLITQNKNMSFIMDLLNINTANAHGLKHAICALISVIASTIKGVDYLTQIDLSIAEKVIEILKEQEDGSVTQRFCIAILQKMSVKEVTIELFVQKNMIQWVLKLLEKSKGQDIHIFSLDFSSALLANILHSHSTLDYLEKNTKVTKDIMVGLLSLLKENIPTSVLMHILICLSYLSKERFSSLIEQC
mmetsp:Transcript_12517/g.12301  ORF Transcript_12517/g.12301 Transcript_12517/m.12301 type:complete len:189 (-) Transcript_12517:297-863(-)